MINHSVADDLLKQHSIPELRQLQEKLYKEANGKKQELQSMVGSKYHDFIQSADAITIMRNKSELMGEKLASFLKCSTDLVSTTNNLLRGDKSSSNVRADPTNASDIPSNLTDAKIWTMLEKCDIFNASISIQLARLLLGDHASGAGQYMTKMDALKGLHLVSSPLKSSCSSCVFLQQTVIDDARLVLLMPNLSATEQAQTLSSMGILGGLKRGELLTRFFECANLMLSETDEEEGDETLDDGDENHLGTRAHHLIQAVKILQKTILDVHALFFKPATADNLSPAAQDSLAALKPLGLLAAQQLQLMHEVVARFKLAVPAEVSTEAIGFDRVGFDVRELKATGQAELKRVFDKWLAEAVRKVTDTSRKVLGGMQSAAQVARLQQIIFQCSTVVQTDANGYSQQDWHAASMDLLATPRLRARLDKESESGSTVSASDDPTKLLWSTALRAPFMLQVERLLRTSCQGVLTRARGHLFNALEAEGLSVDSFTLGVSVGSSSPYAAAPSSSQSAAPASSSRLFRRAEQVRVQLEEDITDLLADIVHHPAGGKGTDGTAEGGASDPQSTAALSRAFYVQCSQLLAQLAVTLRTLGNSITNALEARQRLRDKLAVELRNDDDHPFELLMSGLLFVGRFAWLLKIRGKFLEDALITSPINTAAGASSSITFDLSSEDQIRSAFEIADTDGDGVVTYSEAVEAVQALAVGDSEDSRGASHASQTPFLSMLLTPSVTFTEMTMLCAHLMPAETCRPVDRLRACIEDLVDKMHSQWSDRVVNELGAVLADDLSMELGMRGHSHFKASWRQHTVDMDGSKEQLVAPSACSHALSKFFLALNQRAAQCLISIDTIQMLPPATSASTTSATGVARLSAFALTKLYGAAMECAISQYSATLKSRPQDIAQHSAERDISKASLKLLVERLQEDCALQAVFDLAVIETVAGRCCVPIPKTMRTCLAGWQGGMDPISADLFTPVLKSASDLFASRTFLLFPGLKAGTSFASAGKAVATSGTVENDAVSGVFASDQRDQAPCRFALLPSAISTHSYVPSGSLKPEKEAEKSTSGASKKGGAKSGGQLSGLLGGLGFLGGKSD